MNMDESLGRENMIGEAEIHTSNHERHYHECDCE